MVLLYYFTYIGDARSSTNQALLPVSVICKSKGKAIPLQAWAGPEGSGRLRLQDFKTIGT